MNISDRADIGAVLLQMREMRSRAAEGAATDVAPQPTRIEGNRDVPGFGELLGNAIDQVNGLQKESARFSDAVERGDPGVSLAQAMIASQKASVAFQATSEVRNKLVKAYETIMNMPI